MIELRWVVFGPNRQLEYRCYSPSVDASGALTAMRGAWENWKSVPEVDGDEAALQDLIASGGIGNAP